MYSSTLRTASLGVLALALGALAVPAGADTPADLPRYRLQVGQELAYSGSGEFKYTDGQFITKSTWRIWVVRENKDGGWRLILRSGSAMSQGGVKSANERETVNFAWCDLLPDGRFAENDSFGFQMQPGNLLPLLPRDEATARQGWSRKDTRMDETQRYRLVSDLTDADRCVLEATRESPMNAIYGFSFKDRVTFDVKRGLVEKIESEQKQTYGFNGEGKGQLRLEEVKTHNAAWCNEFAADADRYFAAHQTYSKATARRNRSAEEIKTDLEQAAAGLKAARDELKLPVWQKQVDDLLAQHSQNVKYYVEDARNRATVFGKPSPEWSTQDLDGKDHALKDYRGKVVVLDFWYRGCGWCVRAMPQMMEIAAHFKDRPVAVFGMNTDRNEADARFVIDKMGLNYPNLKATGLPEKYKVRGFPTLLILDQEGVVRDIHVGYSPTLREEVVRSVEQLLKGAP